MHWTANVPSIAFTLFGRDVAWYGIIITTSMLIGLLVSIKRGKRIGLTSDDFLEIFMIAIPMAIIFARLGYVFARPAEYLAISNFSFEDFIRIFAIWDGGLTIMTGVPGGILGGYIWSKWRKVDFIATADLIIPVVLLCQALGRWGNFLNQEIYGAAVTNPNLQFFPFAVYIQMRGGFFQAVFFYEMVLDLLAFGAMLFLVRRLRVRGVGLPMYGAFYSLIRFVMEFFRDDGDVYEKFNFNIIICGVIFVACVGLMVFLIVKARKKGTQIWYKNKIPDNLYIKAKLKEEIKVNNA